LLQQAGICLVNDGISPKDGTLISHVGFSELIIGQRYTVTGIPELNRRITATRDAATVRYGAGVLILVHNNGCANNVPPCRRP